MAARTAHEMSITMSTHYGIPVSEIGDDGNVVALGHHDTRRVVAALNRHARVAWGFSNLTDDDETTLREITAEISERWGVLCAEQADEHDVAWWLDTHSITAETPGAFPITLWEIT